MAKLPGGPPALDWQAHDWEAITQKLMAYLGGLVGRPVDPDAILANGLSMRDLVHQVIADCLDPDNTTVQWDPQRGPLLPFLKTVLQRDYLDLIKAQKNQKTDYLEEVRNPAQERQGPDLDNPDGWYLSPARKKGDRSERKLKRAKPDFFDWYHTDKKVALAEHEWLVTDQPLGPEERLLFEEALAAWKKAACGDERLAEVIDAIVRYGLHKPLEHVLDRLRRGDGAALQDLAASDPALEQLVATLDQRGQLRPLDRELRKALKEMYNLYRKLRPRFEALREEYAQRQPKTGSRPAPAPKRARKPRSP